MNLQFEPSPFDPGLYALRNPKKPKRGRTMEFVVEINTSRNNSQHYRVQICIRFKEERFLYLSSCIPARWRTAIGDAGQRYEGTGVFITKYGQKYHVFRACPTLTSSVLRSSPPCDRCGFTIDMAAVRRGEPLWSRGWGEIYPDAASHLAVPQDPRKSMAPVSAAFKSSVNGGSTCDERMKKKGGHHLTLG